jgi:hypothetical protein
MTVLHSLHFKFDAVMQGAISWFCLILVLFNFRSLDIFTT